MRANLPNKDWFIDKTLPQRSDLIIQSYVASGNDAHLFRGYSSSLQRTFACKVIPRANLIGVDETPPRWRAEIEKANSLRSDTVVKFSDFHEWRVPEAGIDCIVLVADFIEGVSLRDFLRRHRTDVSIPFILLFLETVLDLFNEMLQKAMSHGDFHEGNILVEERSFTLRGPRHVFRVTDFGVAAATSDLRFKDDYLQVASVLRQLLEVLDYSSLSAKDKYIYNILNNDFLARHLTEMDQTIDPLAKRPAALFHRVRDLDSDFDKSVRADTSTLLTPFDFLSCEQIGDAPSILKALYSDLFLGLPEIEGRNNVVITGPRGCGKSTVFRNASLRHKMRVGDDKPDQVPYVGIYYRCDDLYFSFPRYTTPTLRAEALDLPVHFVTATLLSDLLDSLTLWALPRFADDFQSVESRVSTALWELLELPRPNAPGDDSFRALVAALQKQRRRAVERHRFVNDLKHPIGRLFCMDVIQKACMVLMTELPFLRDRPIYFFVDDYSLPKITRDLQLNLNRVFMQRSAYCFYKLSTESPVSFVSADIDGKEYVEKREYNLLNVGLVYLHDEADRKRAFVEDVFRRRLGASVNYPVKDLDTLIGADEDSNFNEDARQIREKRKLTLWGKRTLCNLCSGDVFYLINLVRTMVMEAGGPEGISQLRDGPRVSREIQNKAIRDAAGDFLKNLRGSCEFGGTLVAIVTAFGNVAHSFLRHKDSRNEEAGPPHQATRIEPYEPPALSPHAKQLYEELLRYSVFIEDFRGKSRRGKVVPRLYLRRFLIPHFNLTFSMRDSIELEPADFELFLTKPTEFEERFRLKEPKEGDVGQLPLSLNGEAS